MNSPRAMFFVDGNNLYHGLKAMGVSIYQIDFGELANRLLISNRQHIKTFFYIATVNRHEAPDLHKSQQSFLADLKKSGIEVRLGYLQDKVLECPKCKNRATGITCQKCGRVFGKKEEKGVDVFLATDLVYHAAVNSYDIAYVITSDGDLAEACRRAVNLGKRVFYVCLPPVSAALQSACSSIIRKDKGFFMSCMK